MLDYLKSPLAAALALFIVSAILHFGWIGHPNEAVFDEVHFGKFVSGYLTGEYYFDIHPPLGKLMIAGVAKLADFEPRYGFLNIGEHYPDNKYIWLRVMPALFGSLLVPLVFLLALRLSRSLTASILAGFFITFENALLVQSKFILMDSFLLFFGFLGLYLFLCSRDFFAPAQDGNTRIEKRERDSQSVLKSEETRWWGLWAVLGSGAALGLSISIKWTGVSFLGLALLLGLVGIIRRMRDRDDYTRMLYGYGILIIVPFLLYISFFYIHFKLLPKPGPGDGFMTSRFHESRATGYPPGDFLANFRELNKEMFAANRRITTEHSYSSTWRTWPFMMRSVYYWNKDIQASPESDDRGGSTSGGAGFMRIYLLGNPFVWWTSSILTGIFLVLLVRNSVVRILAGLTYTRRKARIIKLEHPLTREDIVLAIGWAANLVPFAFIGRVMFLYHYFAALIFAVIIAAIMIERLRKGAKSVLALVIILTILGFYIITPVTYGSLLRESWPSSIFWFQSWI